PSTARIVAPNSCSRYGMSQRIALGWVVTNCDWLVSRTKRIDQFCHTLGVSITGGRSLIRFFAVGVASTTETLSDPAPPGELTSSGAWATWLGWLNAWGRDTAYAGVTFTYVSKLPGNPVGLRSSW